LAVSPTAGVSRARDSAELPEVMRRDVRLLGEILGEVISESAGADLLADVERLRHAVIDARSAADRGSAQAMAAGDEIMALVSGWSWELAELLARLRVHPVFTAHPTEARRRAVVASLRRVSGLLTSVDDEHAGAAQQ